MEPIAAATRINAINIFFIGITPLESDRELAEERLVVRN